MAFRLCNSMSKMYLQKNGVPLMNSMLIKRTTTHDTCRKMIGKREIVGYGWSGCPVYFDRIDYPFPAIRFREPTVAICELREKERSDWRKLSIQEKQTLYRYSFCQTFAEFQAPTGSWKLIVGRALWIIALGLFVAFGPYVYLYDDLPESFNEDHRKAQLKRMIALEVNPVRGLASKWDYENNCWK